MKTKIIFLLLLLFFNNAIAMRVLFLGDSLTEGYGVAENKAYPNIIAQTLKQIGYDITILNAGISGSTSAGAYARLQWHLQNKPDILLLALGANDGLRGLSIDEMKKNLTQTIELAQKNNIKVILAGMKIPPNYGRNYQRRYDRSFKEIAKKTEVVFIPFLLEGIAADPSFNLNDGIHPNAQGHEKIAELVLPYLIPLIEQVTNE